MKKVIVVLSLAVMFPVAVSWAQLLPPNRAGVTLSHWHTIVRVVEATKKFWILLGGVPMKIDGTDVMKFPGVFVFLTPGTPTGDSMGSVITKVGFTVVNGEPYEAKLRTAGVNFLPPAPTPPGRPSKPVTDNIVLENGVAVTSPDGLKISLKGSDFFLSQRIPLGFSPTDWINIQVASDNIETSVPIPRMAEVQAWYVKVLGGSPLREVNSFQNYAVDWPGARLRISPLREPRIFAPTKGRALDHIGFEVKNLGAYCKRLEAMGVKFDAPYSKTRHQSFASAELTDPWGASYELTEGLDKF